MIEEAIIAAIAKVYQLTVLTRNVADFSRFDLALLNPFAP
jgi:predicted nucleic acid-binding protein